MVKTASKVNDFLHNDLKEYLANAGMHKADLSSPQLTPDAVSHSNSNSAEGSIMKIFDYENKCWAVGCAINNCNRINRQILKSSVIKDISDAEQIMNIGLSNLILILKNLEFINQKGIAFEV